MLFWPIVGHFLCSVVTLVTFSSNLNNFEKIHLGQGQVDFVAVSFCLCVCCLPVCVLSVCLCVYVCLRVYLSAHMQNPILERRNVVLLHDAQGTPPEF